jgi:hypothetical protein
MATNLYKQFKDIFPDAPLLIGTVTLIDGKHRIVTLPDGNTVRAIGEFDLNKSVFVKESIIQGEAPVLPVYTINV